jgi:hypothetical protein
MVSTNWLGLRAPLDRDLHATLSGMEQGFQVRLIATFDPDVVSAPPDAIASEWLASHHPAFDQFPVRDGDATIGVLLRDRTAEPQKRTVREAMHPLRDGMMVSADTPIADLIPALKEGHCRLVLRGDRINGLVTQSDLLKLPVRMLFFGLITHLEIVLRAVIGRRLAWEGWAERLPGDRRRQVRREFKSVQDARLDPDPLEFTVFGDLIDVLRGEADFDAAFIEDLMRIRAFRNTIAHAKTYVQRPEDVVELVTTFMAIRSAIERASRIAGTEK